MKPRTKTTNEEWTEERMKVIWMGRAGLQYLSEKRHILHHKSYPEQGRKAVEEVELRREDNRNVEIQTHAVGGCRDCRPKMLCKSLIEILYILYIWHILLTTKTLSTKWF